MVFLAMVRLESEPTLTWKAPDCKNRTVGRPQRPGVNLRLEWLDQVVSNEFRAVSMRSEES